MHVDQPVHWCLDTLHRHSTRYTDRPHGGIPQKDIQTFVFDCFIGAVEIQRFERRCLLSVLVKGSWNRDINTSLSLSFAIVTPYDIQPLKRKLIRKTMTTSAPKTKPRILCLHGGYSNNDITEIQICGLKLREYAECIFLHGTYFDDIKVT